MACSLASFCLTLYLVVRPDQSPALNVKISGGISYFEYMYDDRRLQRPRVKMHNKGNRS